MTTNIKINYNNKNVRNLTETKFNALYTGNDLIIAGKMENIKNFENIQLSASIMLTIGRKQSGDDNGAAKADDVEKTIDTNFEMDGKQTSNANRIWAYLKLQQLAREQLIRHNDMIEMDDDEQKEEQSLGLRLGLEHKFITPWTSMIVVKHKDTVKEEAIDDEKEYSESTPSTKVFNIFYIVYKIPLVTILTMIIR